MGERTGGGGKKAQKKAKRGKTQTKVSRAARAKKKNIVMKPKKSRFGK